MRDDVGGDEQKATEESKKREAWGERDVHEGH